MDSTRLPIGSIHSAASLLSFGMSFRILSVIIQNKEHRETESLQLLANVCLLECFEMLFSFICNVRLAADAEFNTVDQVLGFGVIICFIGELFQKFALAFSRFSTVTGLQSRKFLGSAWIHKSLLTFPWITVAGLAVCCTYQSTSFGIIKDVNAWLYTEESFMSSFEKISALTLVSLGLVLYVAICVILIKKRGDGASKTEIRLLLAFFFDFFYVVILVCSFHILPNFVEYGITTVWMLNFFFFIMPFVSGIVLLTINKKIRNKFFFSNSLKKIVVSTVTLMKVTKATP